MQSELTTKVKSFSAFTIVEMLVVVCIIGLMATAVMGLYGGSYKRAQLVKSVKEVLLAAKYARLAAVEKQKECKLYLNAETGSFFVSFGQTDTEVESQDRPEGPAVISNPYSRPGKFPESVKFEEIKISSASLTGAADGKIDQAGSEGETEKDCIVFTPYGTADNAVIKIGNGKISMLVCVSAATGKAKVIEDVDQPVTTDVIDLDMMEI